MSGGRLPWVAVGWDQSILHGAAVALSPDGEVLDTLCLSRKAGDATRFPQGRRYRMPARLAGSKGDKAVRAQSIQLWTELWLRRVLGGLDALADVLYIGLEDYAYAAAYGAHQLGAIGGALRRLAITRPGAERHLRLIEPGSLTIFAGAKWQGGKDEVAAAVLAKWGRGGEMPVPAHDSDGDVVDAYVLAQMVRAEVRLRLGLADMRELPDEERRYFLRITKAYPVNVLERHWLDAESVSMWKEGHE